MHFIKDSWLEKIKAHYATELESFKDSLQIEQKRIQARVDRSIFVSRAQFDTEFNAMKDIFRFATDLKLTMDQIRPMFGLSPADETKEQAEKAVFLRADKTVEAYNIFSSQMEILSPFYPETLFAALQQCREAASSELTQVSTAGESTLSPSWFIDGAKNQKRFGDAYHTAAKIIRERLDMLSIIPS